MDPLADLFAIAAADRSGSRQIARITVSPAFWQQLTGSVAEIWHTTSGLDDPEQPIGKDAIPGRALVNVQGIPIEIDEDQQEPWFPWIEPAGDHGE